ncbi:MAG: hypothetical protein KAH21_04565 [Spirochaetaceae bacterium]|nr:hypothetical protein [Spirochaetaceae bacterium]
MKREDYVFAIGFDGNKAIVDKRSRSRFSGLDTRKLADEGLFRAAYRSAVYDSDVNAADYVLEKFNAVSPVKYGKSSDLDKVFGVQPPSDDITGIRAI